jgi:hypothetical protein
MSIRGTVGSLLESHRAKSSHPDRRNFIPQTGRLPSAAQFSGRLPQLRSIVPNSPPSVPSFPTPIPIFRAMLPNAKAPVPNFRKAVPNFPTLFPIFSASLPIFPRVFPNFPATFPNFSPAALVSNGLFPSHLCGIAAKSRKKRQVKPSSVLSDTLSHRMGEGRGEGCLFFPQLRTANSQLLKS